MCTEAACLCYAHASQSSKFMQDINSCKVFLGSLSACAQHFSLGFHNQTVYDMYKAVSSHSSFATLPVNNAGASRVGVSRAAATLELELLRPGPGVRGRRSAGHARSPVLAAVLWGREVRVMGGLLGGFSGGLSGAGASGRLICRRRELVVL